MSSGIITVQWLLDGIWLYPDIFIYVRSNPRTSPVRILFCPNRDTNLTNVRVEQMLVAKLVNKYSAFYYKNQSNEEKSSTRLLFD
jgi:hypothetical protein